MPSRPPLKKNSEAGITLVEIMIAVTITVGLSAAAFSYLNNVEDFRQMMTKVSTRDAIAKRIESQMSSYRNVRFSGITHAGASPGNAQLSACIQESGDCTVKTPGAQTSFAFFVDQGAAGPIKLAGTAQAPVLYDYNGRPNCVAGEAGCPAYEARAYFWATCPPVPAVCKIANQVALRYQVTPLKPLANGNTLPKMPPDPGFSTKMQSFAVRHFVRGAPSTDVNEVCPVGAFQTGSHPNGKIKCSCTFSNQPANIDPVTLNPTACVPAATQCPKDHIINGIKTNGTPRCCRVVPSCDTNWRTFSTQSAACPPGAWMERIDMGYCSDRLGPNDSKSGNKPIGCERNRGICCTYSIGACI